MSSRDEGASDIGAGATSFHLQCARGGSRESLAWLIARLSPLLRMQAAYRLPGRLAAIYDPDDLVHDVWIATIPRLPDLGERDRRCTPVLVRFLGRTLLNKVNQLLAKHAREQRSDSVGGASASRSRTRFDQPASLTGVFEAVQRDEARAALDAAIVALDAADREVVVLRGIEQLSNAEAARMLGESESSTAMRYGRALKKLRERLPNSIFEELDD